MSWLTERDTVEGRQKLNFSEWDRPQKEAGDAAEEVSKGEMPPWFYLPAHPEANLSATERATLIADLQSSAGGLALTKRDQYFLKIFFKTLTALSTCFSLRI